MKVTFTKMFTTFTQFFVIFSSRLEELLRSEKKMKPFKYYVHVVFDLWNYWMKHLEKLITPKSV